MTGALSTWATGYVVDPLRDGEKFIEITRDVETTVIQVPAGVQDYYGAMFGGLQSLSWRPGSHERDWLPTEIFAEVEDRILLFYSGRSRNSGINNWALFKGFIDKEPGVREKFERINAATQNLEKALRAQNWIEAGRAIADEWETRRTLAPGISTPEMNEAFSAASKLGPISGKVCGAGGGGCSLCLSSRTGPHAQIQNPRSLCKTRNQAAPLQSRSQRSRNSGHPYLANERIPTLPRIGTRRR